MDTNRSIKNRVAIVTGGGTGIGRGIAEALAREGARVTICGRRAAPLEATAAAIRSAGGAAQAIQADVSQPEAVDRLVNTVLRDDGAIDILINNAGIAVGAEAHNLDVQTWDRVMAINLRGVMLLTRAVLPAMRQKRSGHIINISSESGLNYYDGDVVYGLSKHALNDFGEYVQRENQDYNIRLNTICPGMVVSEMSANEPGLDHSKCLYPEDIADLALWLITRRPNVKIGTPILIQTMLNPWE